MRNINSYKLDHCMELGQDNKAFVENEIKDDWKLSFESKVIQDDDGVKAKNGSVVVDDVIQTPENADETGRDTWDNPIEFLMSCISMSVGLGNIWRFPFTAYENGGGAFLIPYLIVLFFIGKPLYFLEMALGQFSSYGQVKVWNLAPLFKGVGYGSMIGTACVVSYYTMLMALTVFYFIASFNAILPWAQCNLDWTPKELCIDGEFQSQNTTKSLSELYFNKEVFPELPNVDNGIGYPEWRLTLCLLAAWLIIFFSLVKGVKSSGKVAYFTAIFPYVVLFILLVRGITLEGAWTGIKYFIEPQWEVLYQPKVWYAAVGQCFFSLSTGFGPIIMFASYNPFKRNVYKDAFIISLMDTFTSLLAGFTIFSILGYLAVSTGQDVRDVVQSGPGLAFISYPQAIAKFDFIPQLFAVLFFLMLFTLGVGSATSLTSGIITVICDAFPDKKRVWVTSGVCIIGFLLGLIYVTPGGQFMLTLVDHFGANFVIYVMATLEVIGVCWVYGVNNFAKDIEFMLGIKIGFYWKFCWGFFTPVGLSAILIYTLVTFERLEHNKVPFPNSAIAAGWALACFALLVLPVCGIHAVWTRKSSGFIAKLKESIQPTKKWGPQPPKLKAEWLLFREKSEQTKTA